MMKTDVKERTLILPTIKNRNKASKLELSKGLTRDIRRLTQGERREDLIFTWENGQPLNG